MSRYSIPPLVTREEERNRLLVPSGVGGDVLADGVDDGRVTVKAGLTRSMEMVSALPSLSTVTVFLLLLRTL